MIFEKITVGYLSRSNESRVALSSLNSYHATDKGNVAVVQNLITWNNLDVSFQRNGEVKI